MTKKIILIILVINTFAEIAAQKLLRENVPIVRAAYSEASKDFLQTLANRIRRNGYRYSADHLENIIKGGFGSGFVYTDSVSGKAYIISNRHVVAQASSATVEFTHLNENVVFEDCKIAAIDEELDLALIELPENRQYNVGSGLKITSEVKEEGTEVFSAGFPGLAGKPSWQFGKGIISNSSVKSDIFSGTNKIGAIQHTAPIDPGSSGGPLMIKDEGVYEIIGANTWGLVNRENAYFAISGKVIKTFLSKYVGKAFNSEADLERRAKDFIKNLKANYTKASPYISDEYVVSMSTDSYFEIMINVPDSVERKMKKLINSGFPINAVRVGLTHFLHKEQAKNKVKFVRIEATDSPNEKKVVLSSKEKEFDTFWVYTLGEWRLKEYTRLKIKNLEADGIAENFNPDKSWKLGYEKGSSSNKATYDLVSLEQKTFFSSYLSMGWRAAFGNLEIKHSEPDALDVDTETGTMLLINCLLEGHLPIKVRSVYFIPYASVSPGIALCEEGGFQYSLGGGLDFAYKINRSLYLTLGAAYKNRNIVSDYHKPFNSFQVHIGVTY